MIKHLVVLAFGLSTTSSWAAGPLIEAKSEDVVLTGGTPAGLNWLAEISHARLSEHAVVEDGRKKGQSRFDLRFALRRSVGDGLEIREFGLNLDEDRGASLPTKVVATPTPDEGVQPKVLFRLELDRAALRRGGEFQASKACAEIQTSPIVLKIIPTDSNPISEKKPGRRFSLASRKDKHTKASRKSSKPGTKISGALSEYVLEFWQLSGAGIPKKHAGFKFPNDNGESEDADGADDGAPAYYINVGAAPSAPEVKDNEYNPELHEEVSFQTAIADLGLAILDLEGPTATATIVEDEEQEGN